MLDLQSGNTHSYISYLKDIVDEECDLSVRAGVLMERLKAYCILRLDSATFSEIQST